MRFLKVFIVFIIMSSSVSAKEYTASFFGIKSNGTTNNTASIQQAIDYIHLHGGGTLVFYVGRYLTGTIHLKTRVNIRLEEGAVLVGARSPYDYNHADSTAALLVAEGQTDIKIYGEGVIEGAGATLIKNIDDLMNSGYISENRKPALISFSNCTNVSVKCLHLWYGPYMAIKAINCKIVKFKDVDINGRNISLSGGILLKDCKWITMEDLFIKVEQEPVITTNNQYLKIENSITNTGKSLSSL